jgi:hypothetical protein
MPWAVAAAGIGAAGAIGGGIMSSDAAGSAAKAQENSLSQALGLGQGVYSTAQNNLNPYILTGSNALGDISGLLGIGGATPGNATGSGSPGTANGNATAAFDAFTKTPYYQFPLQQGIQAMDASGAAKGLTLSGGQMNALQQYGQGYASGQLGNYLNALSALAGMGQSAAGTVGNIGISSAGLGQNALSQSGQAASAGIVGGNNALFGTNGTVSQLSGIFNGLANNPALMGGSSYNQGFAGTASPASQYAGTNSWTG